MRLPSIVHSNVCNFCLQSKFIWQETETGSRSFAAHFPALAITQHMSTHWMPLNQAMSKAVRK